MAAVHVDAPPSGIARIERAFDLGDREAVCAMIDRPPVLAALLIEAADIIPTYFGSGPRAVLDVIRDPEEPASSALYAFLQVALDADEALDRLDRFIDDWWRSASARLAAPLHFAFDYV